jgi:hypothetical protein
VEYIWLAHLVLGFQMQLDVSCTYTLPITLSKALVYTSKDTQNLVILALEQKT